MSFPYAEIEKKIGYAFQNQALLLEAFTHKSYSHHTGEKDNDRMEYLGDAVLQLVVSQWLYGKEDGATAGEMTNARQALVCKSALDSAVDAIGVYSYLRYKGTEKNLQGKTKSSLFEAITAAIYLDGGYAEAEKFILRYGNLHLVKTTGNAIGELKEFLEKNKAREPIEEWEKIGADNAPTFKLKLTAMGESANGEGRSKQEAKAVAAARLLWELKNRKK